MQQLDKNIIKKAIKKAENHIEQLSDYRDLCLFGGFLDKLYYKLLYCNEIKDKENLFYNYFQQIYSEFSKGKTAFNFAGIVGILWVSNILYEKKIIIKENFKVDNNLQNLILDTAIKLQTNNLYDLFSGSIGNVNAVLSIANNLNKEQEKLIIEYLKTLEKTAESVKDCDGYKWISYYFAKKEYVYNLSLSHGIASIVALLCKTLEKCSCYNSEIKEYSERIIRKAINYILSNEIDFEKYKSHFPNLCVDYYNDKKLYGSRLAWCYGDLGIAYTFLRAALILDDTALLNKSTSILLDCTKRIDYTENNIFDPWFCHGTCGIAYIFKKIYEKTNIEDFNISANFWLSETINMLNTNYKDYIFNKNPNLKKDFFKDKNVSNTIIEGYTGIAMVLRSFLNTDNCEWEQFFLLN